MKYWLVYSLNTHSLVQMTYFSLCPNYFSPSYLPENQISILMMTSFFCYLKKKKSLTQIYNLRANPLAWSPGQVKLDSNKNTKWTFSIMKKKYVCRRQTFFHIFLKVSSRNENFNLLVWIKFLNLFLYIHLYL
jgi:hypothetical protein